MTAEELAAFIAEARAELDARVAELDSIDPALLTPEEREAYDASRAACDDLRAMMEEEAVQLQIEASVSLGRDLTLEEAKALVRKQ